MLGALSSCRCVGHTAVIASGLQDTYCARHRMRYIPEGRKLISDASSDEGRAAAQEGRSRRASTSELQGQEEMHVRLDSGFLGMINTLNTCQFNFFI